MAGGAAGVSPVAAGAGGCAPASTSSDLDVSSAHARARSHGARTQLVDPSDQSLEQVWDDGGCGGQQRVRHALHAAARIALLQIAAAEQPLRAPKGRGVGRGARGVLRAHIAHLEEVLHDRGVQLLDVHGVVARAVASRARAQRLQHGVCQRVQRLPRAHTGIHRIAQRTGGLAADQAAQLRRGVARRAHLRQRQGRGLRRCAARLVELEDVRDQLLRVDS